MHEDVCTDSSPPLHPPKKKIMYTRLILDATSVYIGMHCNKNTVDCQYNFRIFTFFFTVECDFLNYYPKIIAIMHSRVYLKDNATFPFLYKSVELICLLCCQRKKKFVNIWKLHWQKIVKCILECENVKKSQSHEINVKWDKLICILNIIRRAGYIPIWYFQTHSWNHFIKEQKRTRTNTIIKLENNGMFIFRLVTDKCTFQLIVYDFMKSFVPMSWNNPFIAGGKILKYIY